MERGWHSSLRRVWNPWPGGIVSYVQIKTDRGSVRVIDKDCKYRLCLHIHWSRHYETSKILANGKRVETYPLVCCRNEEHGCPHPLPEPNDAA